MLIPDTLDPVSPSRLLLLAGDTVLGLPRPPEAQTSGPGRQRMLIPCELASKGSSKFAAVVNINKKIISMIYHVCQ